MTRLIIVRHAESALNLQKRIQGHMDSALTPRGRKQAERLGQRIKTMKIDKIYSSDLGRCYTTTLAVAKHKRLSIIRDPFLREIHLGDWEGMTPEEVDRLYDKGYQKWLRGPSAMKIPKGETLKRFRMRVIKRIGWIARKNPKKTVLVVTHGGVITALIAHWLQADFDSVLLRLRIDNTSLTIIDQHDKRTRVECINDASHLFNKGNSETKLLDKD